MGKNIIITIPIIFENRQLLLIQEDEDFWKFCETRVKDFEKRLVDNLKERIKEKMGFGIEIFSNISPLVLYTRRNSKDDKIDVILVHYPAKRISAYIAPTSSIKKWGWFRIDSLPEKLSPNVPMALKYFGYIKK